MGQIAIPSGGRTPTATPTFKGLGGGSDFSVSCNVGDILILARAADYNYPNQGIVTSGVSDIFSYQSSYAHIHVYRATSSKPHFNNATVGVMAVAKLTIKIK